MLVRIFILFRFVLGTFTVGTFVKDGEEIGATNLYSQRTPTEIRRQKKKRPFSGLSTTSTLATVRDKKLKATHIKLPTENVIIGTWNVRTLNQCGKLKELIYTLDMYRWNIIGLSQTL